MDDVVGIVTNTQYAVSLRTGSCIQLLWNWVIGVLELLKEGRSYTAEGVGKCFKLE